MQRRESLHASAEGTNKLVIKGRGAPLNPAGRFEKLESLAEEHDDFPDSDAPQEPKLETQIFRDTSRSVVTFNDSPDVGMEATVNPYRGCEHGCIYCFARPYHEYLGFSAGLDFETKIFAKTDAPALLRKKFMTPRWEPVVILMSGITDPYQPLEKKLKITRGCLEVFCEFRNPVSILTKNHLVTRDIDLFQELASHQAAAVNVSITTLDKELARKMEPRASTPDKRFAAVEALSKAGIPVNVMVGPVLPGLTEHEIPSLLERSANAGARTAAFTLLRLPYGVKDLFEAWLKEHYPDRAQKVLNRVRDIRGGRLNDPNFFTRKRGQGEYAEQIRNIFALSRKRYGLDKEFELSTAAFRKKSDDRQFTLEI